MSKPARHPPEPAPLLTAADLVAILRIHDRTLRTWNSLGRVPTPLKIGRNLRWRREEIDRRILVGCPPRSEWEGIANK